MQKVSVNHLNESRNFLRILVSSDLPNHGLLKEIPIFSHISQVSFLLSFQISPRSFWASLLPSLFPYGEFFIPPFDSLGSLFFLSPFGAPDSFTPPLKVLYSSPFPPPQNFMGPFSLTLPFRLCRFIPPPPKFFIAPFPSSLGLENKISPWGPRSYLSPPLNSLDSFPSPPSEPPIPSPFPSPFPSEFFNHSPQIP